MSSDRLLTPAHPAAPLVLFLLPGVAAAFDGDKVSEGPLKLIIEKIPPTMD